MVVDKPQSTRVEEPTLLCNQVDFKFPILRRTRAMTQLTYSRTFAAKESRRARSAPSSSTQPDRCVSPLVRPQGKKH